MDNWAGICTKASQEKLSVIANVAAQKAAANRLIQAFTKGSLESTYQRDDFRKGHIAGSINLLPSEIKANNVGELEKHKDKPVIVVDGSGMQCQEPANALTKAGFAQVFVLKEGVAGWAGENLPLVRGK